MSLHTSALGYLIDISVLEVRRLPWCDLQHIITCADRAEISHTQMHYNILILRVMLLIRSLCLALDVLTPSGESLKFFPMNPFRDVLVYAKYYEYTHLAGIRKSRRCDFL